MYNDAEIIVKRYIYDNICFIRNYLEENIPQIRMIMPEGTYLVWLDFRAYGLSDAELDGKIVKEAGLWLDSGKIFGAEGSGFQRINVATPRSILLEALERLSKVFGRL